MSVSGGSAGTLSATIPVTNPGAGYTSPPTVTVVGGNPTTPATVLATINAGGEITALTDTGVNQITTNGVASIAVNGLVSINVATTGNKGGSGYSTATPPMVSISAPTGANPVLASANAVITPFGFTTLVGGSGYTTPPMITFTGGGTTPANEATAVPIMLGGTVIGINVTSAGSGYTSAPTVTFSAPPPTGGTRATVTAVFGPNQITGFVITNPGSGYISVPSVTVVGGSPAVPAIRRP